jgi:hypothetical protein
MRGTRNHFETYEEFAREELRDTRITSWSVDDLTDEFIACADLDLKLIEGESEPDDDDDD